MSVTNDYISRQDAINEIDSLYFDTVDDHDRTKERIKRLPSAQSEDYAHGFVDGYTQGKKDAQPERKTGKWEYHSNPNIRGGMNPEDAYCSVCGFHIYTPEVDDFDDYNFCPNCGTDMNNCSNDENKWVSEIHDRLMDETGGKAVYKNEHWGRGDNNE